MWGRVSKGSCLKGNALEGDEAKRSACEKKTQMREPRRGKVNRSGIGARRCLTPYQKSQKRAADLARKCAWRIQLDQAGVVGGEKDRCKEDWQASKASKGVKWKLWAFSGKKKVFAPFAGLQNRTTGTSSGK